LSGKRSIFRRITPPILILFFLVSSLGAEELTEAERELPVWVLMEKGKASFREGDFATAHTFFSYARNKGAVLPEAEYWMGRVFEEEGELTLAVAQYQKALEQSRYLYIGDDHIDIAYRLADSYKKSGEWDKYEFQLQVLVDGEIARNQEIMDREHLYAVTLKEKGLDELLYLYRLNYSYSLRAFRELGVYYYKQGRYRSCTIYNLYSVMTYFSLGINELIKDDPEFQFPRTLDKLLEYNKDWYYDDVERSVRLIDPEFSFVRVEGSRDLVNEKEQVDKALAFMEASGDPYYYSGVGYVLDLFRHNKALVPFMKNHNIYQSLYYLACSLYAEGFSESARHIWSILSRDTHSGSWSLSARDQLSSPHIDKSAPIF
jgi:tetratricopeptide (TPR) repeat protein